GEKPVKIMLERDAEQEVAGMRPSGFARVKIAAAQDGKLVAWESRSWGTGGVGGGGTPPLPYIFEIPNQRKQNIAIVTNQGSARAWRAPNHPQAAAITMTAIEDLAAKMNIDPLDFITRNLDLTGSREKIYRDELPIAAELMEWKKNWHPRGDKAEGPIKRGLGLSLHTWGGRGHNSDCDLTIYPDGSVEIKMATQDLGTGCRTIIMIVAADTLGIPLDKVKLLIGDSRYPVSGASGGSTTSGGVTSSTRRRGCARSTLRQSCCRIEGATGRIGSRECNRAGEERPQPQPLVEGSMCEDRRHADDDSRQESRQVEATGLDQQRRWRRADGRRLRGQRNRHRAREQNGRGAGLRPGGGREDCREPGAGRSHHGHQLCAVRGEDSRSRHRAHVEPEHGVLSPGGHRRCRRTEGAHDDRQRLRRARRHRIGGTTGGLARRGDLECSGQCCCSAGAVPAAHSGPCAGSAGG